ncbi:MAG TPA: response regulator [Rhizobacter sp.]|nr:response regulator [Rhizobacter sp.]
MSLKALIVDDDREVRTLIASVLAVEGFEVVTAVSASEARALLAHAAPDVVILDLGLPDADGSVLLRELRVPVVVVSARQDEAGKIALLDAGADDYVVKPFSVPELLARVRVALRHRGVSVAPAQTRYAVDGLEIDLDSHRVLLHGAALHLTPTEYRLLARLVRSAGRVVTHRQLLVDVWGPEFTEHTHYLRIYMGTLRGKIEADPAAPRHLLTEPGVGYRLADD